MVRGCWQVLVGRELGLSCEEDVTESTTVSFTWAYDEDRQAQRGK